MVIYDKIGIFISAFVKWKFFRLKYFEMEYLNNNSIVIRVSYFNNRILDIKYFSVRLQLNPTWREMESTSPRIE